MNLKYFVKAKKASLNSKHKFMVGAALVIGKSVYLGYNKAHKTDPSLDCEYPTVHAELDAIKKAGVGRDLSSASLYVYRHMRNGEIGLAKPCPACAKYIEKAGIQEYHYSIRGEENKLFFYGTMNKLWTNTENVIFIN